MCRKYVVPIFTVWVVPAPRQPCQGASSRPAAELDTAVQHSASSVLRCSETPALLQPRAVLGAVLPPLLRCPALSGSSKKHDSNKRRRSHFVSLPPSSLHITNCDT